MKRITLIFNRLLYEPSVHFMLIALWMVSGSLQAQSYPAPAHKKSYSVLALGETLKVAVERNGIYKITYEDLLSGGLLSDEIASQKIALYGNVSGMLPTFNLAETYDDLSPLPISLHDGGDGMFGPGDYFLFFGESPHRWTYENEKFRYIPHNYSDLSFYFVSLHAEIEHRVESATVQTVEAPLSIEDFPEHIRYETNTVNLCHGGYTWVGETFAFSGNERSFTLSSPDPKAGEKATLEVATIATSFNGTASFLVSCNDVSFSIYHSAYSSTSVCADNRSAQRTVSVNGNNTTVRLSFNKTGSTEAGYLDYINLFYTRRLRLSEPMLSFRSPEAIGKNARFIVEASSSSRIWDITDIYHIAELATTVEGSGKISFSTRADGQLHEYIAFDPAHCPSPRFDGKVKAQNLHELQNISFIVVSYPDFLEQAQQIARLHRERDGITAYVATTEEVYNEFSSGAKDPSAIRLFLKCIRDKSDEAKRPSSLLLFGAASYDYKNILGNVSDFVPTLEAYGNNIEGAGTPSEDNFGYLDDNAGTNPENATSYGKLEVAIGRLPVRTVEEARNMVEKIDIYSSRSYIHDPGQPNLSGNFGNWRNEVVFVTDDGFEEGMETMILSQDYILNHIPYIHLSKLYSDYYQRESSSVTSRIPDLENAIREQVENGCLFIGYYGHSGWNSWSDEKILTNDIIDSWKTSYTFPIMMASSCSFAYYDQIAQVSGAERSVLKAHAGAIAMVATSRIATTKSIEDIQKRFAESLIQKNEGKITTIGEAFLFAKTTAQGGGANKFMLLGDPALRVALPEHNIETLRINGKEAGSADLDTLKALSPITIEGQIVRHDNTRIEDFNGTLMIKIYDKTVTKTTLGLYNPQIQKYNEPVTYTDQNSLLFQGTTEVKDGFFSFSFIVPKDIQYSYGNGRISYYAYSENSDANGSFDRIVVGGFNEDAVLDTTAPIVDLFIEKNNYLGGTVGEEPYLYAEISDAYGINTTGAGIGHDMTVVLDDDLRNPIVVNNHFRYNTGSYKEGYLRYPLNHLEPGRHTVRLKVWNINNISTTRTISFNVDGSSRFKVFDMKAVPNPVRGGYVDFYFNHNGVGGGVERCDFNVFSLQGTRVADFSYRISDLSGYSIGPLRWNLSSNSGKPLQAGMYVCHMKAVSADGKVVQQSVKLVVIH